MRTEIYLIVEVRIGILYYLIFLVIAEINAMCGLAPALDYYGKCKNYNKIICGTINIIFIRSNYEKERFLSTKGRPISKQSLIFQIANIAYVLIYLTVAAIEVFVYPNFYICILNVIVMMIYGGACMMSACFLSVKRRG